ncbi:PP2C family serine/threonine-protein phosphatase [Legionella clemsonensis]|uniref:Protein phosphatase 2C n=1 Tax=Legionella clemsonensis TaxID=1867846 RepID=A0A222P292_9GAMM|nr:PP2C family serine/threonine-protein phosphatase [Legionella clemsonensis]ASQ45941.1 Protein phosphatase 2C [Legionella clemsonensis]
MIEIISLPGKVDVENENRKYKFGCCEARHARPTQEDALAWCVIDRKKIRHLTPQELGKRLWTTYKQLDEEVNYLVEKSGTTASTIVYDGQHHLLVATLADAASFIILYDKQGQVVNVARLNSVIHKPNLPAEKERIKKLGGFITYDGNAYRVNGVLAVSRAIGDYAIKGKVAEKLISSNATIDIVNLNTLLSQNKLVDKLQVITTCDGFTDAAGYEATKSVQESYLANTLANLNDGKPGQKTEKEIAKYLVQKAKRHSWDNISVGVQSLISGQPILLGVYDGHGGNQTARFVAQHVAHTFLDQCLLSSIDYANQNLSTNNNETAYRRDNEKGI